jgi:hypothetical protein
VQMVMLGAVGSAVLAGVTRLALIIERLSA